MIMLSEAKFFMLHTYFFVTKMGNFAFILSGQSLRCPHEEGLGP